MIDYEITGSDVDGDLFERITYLGINDDKLDIDLPTVFFAEFAHAIHNPRIQDQEAQTAPGDTSLVSAPLHVYGQTTSNSSAFNTYSTKSAQDEPPSLIQLKGVRRKTRNALRNTVLARAQFEEYSQIVINAFKIYTNGYPSQADPSVLLPKNCILLWNAFAQVTLRNLPLRRLIILFNKIAQRIPILPTIASSQYSFLQDFLGLIAIASVRKAIHSTAPR